MQVKLITYTNDPLDLLYKAARQCYSKGFTFSDENELINVDNYKKEKFIKEMILETGHLSVLEHVKFTFAFSGVSRALTHQLVRHRIQNISQQSQRYLEDVSYLDSYITPPKISKNKEALEVYENFMKCVSDTYEKLKSIDESIPNEDLRYIFPNATSSNLVSTFDCRTLLHFFEERLCSCAQWEIRNLAKEMQKLVKEVLPCVFEESGPKCKRLKFCNENEKRTCGLMPRYNDIRHLINS